MKYTENLSLKVPEGKDYFEIENFNYNSSTIDDAILTNKDIIDKFKIDLEDVRKVYTACVRRGVAPTDLSLKSILSAINSIKQKELYPMSIGNAYFLPETIDDYFIKQVDDPHSSYDPGNPSIHNSYLFSPTPSEKEHATGDKSIVGFKYNGSSCIISVCFKYIKAGQTNPKSFILGSYFDDYTFDGLIYNKGALCLLLAHPYIYIDNETNMLYVSLPNDPYFLKTAPSYQITPNRTYTVTLNINYTQKSFYTFVFDNNVNLLYSKASLISNWNTLPFQPNQNVVYTYLYFNHYMDHGHSGDVQRIAPDMIMGGDSSNSPECYDRSAYSLSIDLMNTFIALNSELYWGHDTNGILHELEDVILPNPLIPFTDVPSMISMFPKVIPSNSGDLFTGIRGAETQESYHGYFTDVFLGVPYFANQQIGDYFSFSNNIVTFYIRFKYERATLMSDSPFILLGTYLNNDCSYTSATDYDRIPLIIIDENGYLYLEGTEYQTDYLFSLTYDTVYTLIYKIELNTPNFYLYLLDSNGNLISSKKVVPSSWDPEYGSRYCPLAEENTIYYIAFGGNFDEKDISIYGYYGADYQGDLVSIDFMNTFWTEGGTVRWGLDSLDLNGCEDNWPTPVDPYNPEPGPGPGPGPGPDPSNPPDLNTGYYESVAEYDNAYSEQTFTASENNWYKIEVWGAQGGIDPQSGYYNSVTGESFNNDLSYNSNCGGYAVGEIYLQEDTTLYVHVGQQPSSTSSGGNNGGGNGYTMEYTYDGTLDYDATAGYYLHHNVFMIGAGGGGASHVALSSGDLDDFSTNLSDLIIVAGGGGGDSFYCKTGYDDPNSGYYVHTQYCNGGSGGGFIGSTGYWIDSPIPIPDQSDGSNLTDNVYDSSSGYYMTGFGGSQTWPGENYGNIDAPTGYFGQGASGNSGYYTIAGGGGGLYGGASSYAGNASGGGSGWISNSSLKRKHMTTNYFGLDYSEGFEYKKESAFILEPDPLNPDGYYYNNFDLRNGTTSDEKMITYGYFNTSSGYIEDQGKLGNGYVRISKWISTSPSPGGDSLVVGSNTVPVTSSNSTIRYFTPSTTGTYHIYSSGSVDVKLTLYDPSDNVIAEDDDSGPNNNFDCTTNLTANIRYKAEIYDYGNDDNTTVTIEMYAPPVTSALEIGTNTVEVNSNTDYFTFTPSTSGDYRFYSTSSIDPKITINYNGSEVGGDDDGGDDRNFDCTVSLTGGNTYDVEIYYYSYSSSIVGTLYTITIQDVT